MKDEYTTNISNKYLARLIEFCARNRGAKAKVVDKLRTKTGKQWNRENVDRWLHEREERRVQPLLGVGMLLIEIGQEVIKEIDEEAKKAAAEAQKPVDKKPEA